MSPALSLPPSLWQRVHHAAGGVEWPPSSKAEGDRFLEAAAREGVLGLAFEAADLPPAVQEARERQRAWPALLAKRAAILQETLTRVRGLLGDEPIVLLKGADYAARLYPRPHLRPMQDLDLLVPAARAQAVGERLRAGGAQPRLPRTAAARVATHYEHVFILGDVVIEVHTRFLPRARERVDYGAVWERRQPTITPHTFRLDDVDALAYHALSLAKDELTAPLIRWVDLWLLQADAARLEAAADRAAEWGTRRALYGALRRGAQLFPELETPRLAALRERLLAPPTRRFLDRFVLPPVADQGHAGVVTRRRQLWRKLWLMDDLRLRVGFGLAHAQASWRGRR
ncbi:MAG TPA: nucleotidyltransferase family protein [Vicinamibacteria bacterium]